MSDNKRPYDDEQVDINELNDDLDKTKVFNLNSKSDNQNTGEYVSKHSLSNDDYGDDFSGDNEDSEEISSYSQADKANYKDDYDMGQVDDEPKPIVSRTDTYGSPKKKNNNKKPLIIGLIVAAVVLIIVAVVIVLNSCGKNKNDNTETSTTATSTTTVTTTSESYYTSEEETTEYTTEPTTEETTEPTTEEETTEPTTTEAEPTTAPNSDNGNAVNASFAPYKCITPDGDVISDDFASELKGDVSLSLKNNGTYILKVGNVANESGNYEIDGNSITLGSYDGNISFDNAGNPVGVTVYVDDYTVSFN